LCGKGKRSESIETRGGKADAKKRVSKSIRRGERDEKNLNGRPKEKHKSAF